MAKVSRNCVVLLFVAICGLLVVSDQPFTGSQAMAQGQNKPVTAPGMVMNVRTSPRQIAKPEDPYKNARILLEAFVVQADMSRLYEMGVCPLSSESKGISIEHIATCLKEGGAEIIAGAKLTLGQNEEGSAAQQAKETVQKNAPTRPTTASRRPVEEGNRRSSDEPESTSPRRRSTAAAPAPIPTTPRRPAGRTGPFESRFASTTRRFSAEAAVKMHKIRAGWSFEMTNLEEPKSQQESMSNEIERNWSGTTTLDPGKPQIVAAVQDGGRTTFLILTGNIEE